MLQHIPSSAEVCCTKLINKATQKVNNLYQFLTLRNSNEGDAMVWILGFQMYQRQQISFHEPPSDVNRDTKLSSHVLFPQLASHVLIQMLVADLLGTLTHICLDSGLDLLSEQTACQDETEGSFVEACSRLPAKLNETEKV